MLIKNRLFLTIIFLGTAMAQSLYAKLVRVTDINPTIKLDIRYATDHNFTGKAVYPALAITDYYLEEAAARALSAAQEEFAAMGLSLKIFDAYRPRAVQYIFWKLVPDERYVANPAKGSRHNRGCAVDVTLVDAQGNELAMGTEFDDFTEKAHRTCTDLSETVLANRKLLETIMEKHGFEGWLNEWWHFDFKGWQQYELLDISFEELATKS